MRHKQAQKKYSNKKERKSMDEFYQQLCSTISDRQILCNEPMSRHTTFRVGGPADYFIMPDTRQVKDVVSLCRKYQIPYQIIGNGSNLLVSDGGIRGAVIAISGTHSKGVKRSGDHMIVQAGTLLSQAANEAYQAGLGGLEFAAGIPGSVGGAVVMNAGAYGGELKDVVVQVTALAEDGQIVVLSGEEMDFSYRHSCIPACGLIVLEAEFALQPKSKEEIRILMEDLKNRRIEKQPLEYPSAGSTFKRPAGHFAGKLIMDAGLAGFSVGGAEVSKKHCGFVINKGDATASDILTLIHHVQHEVQRQFQVMLELEVKCIGE